MEKPEHVARYVGDTNLYFKGKKTYSILSSNELYLLPAQLISAINQTAGLQSPAHEKALLSIIHSLRKEIERELQQTGQITKCLIDTSPFFAGATQLAWYATETLELLQPGESRTSDDMKVSVNNSVTKCKHQLEFINSVMW